MQFFHFYLIIHCLFLFLQPTTFVVNAAEVPKIIVLPEKSSHFSKYVPEGEEGNAITEVLDVGGRFLVADGSVISVLWSRDIRLISEKHFKKEMDKEKMFVVLFCNANYKPCVNTIAAYEKVASGLKDFIQFGGVDAHAQPEKIAFFERNFDTFEKIETMPTIRIFRPTFQNKAYQVYDYKLDPWDDERMSRVFAEMLPGKVGIVPMPSAGAWVTNPVGSVGSFLHEELPTLLSFAKRKRKPVSFLKSLSLDLEGRLVVHQVNDDIDLDKHRHLASAFGLIRPPALLLCIPRGQFLQNYVEFGSKDELEEHGKRSLRHLKLSKNEPMSHGAIRRWVDRAWKQLKLDDGQPMKSARMIPHYVDPEGERYRCLATGCSFLDNGVCCGVVAIKTYQAIKEDMEADEYNRELDRMVNVNDPEEEPIPEFDREDYRSEL